MPADALPAATVRTPRSRVLPPPRRGRGGARAAALLCGAWLAASLATPARAAAPQEAPVDAGQALAALLEEHHRWSNFEFPESAILRGEPTAEDRVTEVGIAANGRRAGQMRTFLEELHAIDRSRLPAAARLDYDLFERTLTESLESWERKLWMMPVGPLEGPQQSIPQMAERVPFRTADHYRNYVKRLICARDRLRQTTEVMQAGIAAGLLPPRVVVECVPGQCDAVLRGNLEPLREPLARLESVMPAEEAAALRAEAEATLGMIQLEIALFRDFVRDTYLPRCPEDVAASSLPDGRARYDFLVRLHTTLPMSAEEVHQLGLREVARIRAEMLQVIARTDWYAADPARAAMPDEERFAAFLAYLRSDPRFYHRTPESLLAGYRDICKRIDAELPRLFVALPRLPYGVREIPRFMAPQQTTAYYQPGSLQGGNPGWFYANTYALDQRPTYEMIPLALHEAVPGHHLQIALAQELADQPFFRRQAEFTAFVEGWALYAERLGIEMGFFRDDPYADFGRLLYEMWRACRLVVDPGMHAKGWTRAQAVEFMQRNTALSQLNIDREVDRYIAWPGQACAYKVGELTIRELRRAAEARLGPAFDLRRFHEVVLGAGAVPLGVLEARVKEWIEAQAAATAPPTPPAAGTGS